MSETQGGGTHFKIHVPPEYTIIDKSGKRVIDPKFYVTPVEEESFHEKIVKRGADEKRKEFGIGDQMTESEDARKVREDFAAKRAATAKASV